MVWHCHAVHIVHLSLISCCIYLRRGLRLVWCSLPLSCPFPASRWCHRKMKAGKGRATSDYVYPWTSWLDHDSRSINMYILAYICPYIHTLTHMYSHSHYDALFLPHRHNNVLLPVLYFFELQNKSCPVCALTCTHHIKSHWQNIWNFSTNFKRFRNVRKNIETSVDISVLWTITFLWGSEVLNPPKLWILWQVWTNFNHVKLT